MFRTQPFKWQIRAFFHVGPCSERCCIHDQGRQRDLIPKESIGYLIVAHGPARHEPNRNTSFFQHISCGLRGPARTQNKGFGTPGYPAPSVYRIQGVFKPDDIGVKALHPPVFNFYGIYGADRACRVIQFVQVWNNTFLVRNGHAQAVQVRVGGNQGWQVGDLFQRKKLESRIGNAFPGEFLREILF